jgi:hypothetical protein
VFVQAAASPFLRGAPEAPEPSLRSVRKNTMSSGTGASPMTKTETEKLTVIGPTQRRYPFHLPSRQLHQQLAQSSADYGSQF